MRTCGISSRTGLAHTLEEARLGKPWRQKSGPLKCVMRESNGPEAYHVYTGIDTPYDCALRSFSTDSYAPRVIAADGTPRRRCGVRPPYMDIKPSFFKMRRKHWIRPVYFCNPFSIGACRSLVLTT